jgi:hypothetical protein
VVFYVVACKEGRSHEKAPIEALLKVKREVPQDNGIYIEKKRP